MLKATLKGVLAHKVRLLLTALAVVLGVGFVAGTYVLTDTLNATFDNLFDEVTARASTSPCGPNPASATRPASPPGATPSPRPSSRRWPRCCGVKAADGALAGYAQYVDKEGKAVDTGGAPTLGVNWTDVPELNPLRLRDGRAPRGPDEVLMDAGTAKKHDFVGGRQGAHPLPGAAGRLHHRRDRRLRGGRQPGRGHPGRLRHPDHPEGAGQGRPLRHHRRRRRRHRVRPRPPQPGPGRPPRRLRGPHRHPGGRRAVGPDQGGPRVLQHLPARVRRDLAVRGRLHDPEHVLHPGGPAHPGTGSPAGPGRQPHPGAGLGDGGGGHRRAGGVGRRARPRASWWRWA